MKFTIVAFFALLAVVAVSSLPVEDTSGVGFVHQPREHIRVRRFTCDVLSVEIAGNKLNHAACATHCLTRLRAGGYCNGRGICVCR